VLFFVVGYWLFVFFNKQQRTNNKRQSYRLLVVLDMLCSLWACSAVDTSGVINPTKAAIAAVSAWSQTS
jgi:hypothetical protein